MIAKDKVTSFTVDHTKLKPGIYQARSYRGVTTFDVRITEPNKEPAIGGPEYHSLEHLFATWFRNCKIADDVVAVDGMACNTGFYLILFDHGNGSPYTVDEVRKLLLQCLEWISSQDEVPCTTSETCGNYLYHNIHMAIYWAREYTNRLLHDFHCEYTKLQVKLGDGKCFSDS